MFSPRRVTKKDRLEKEENNEQPHSLGPLADSVGEGPVHRPVDPHLGRELNGRSPKPITIPHHRRTIHEDEKVGSPLDLEEVCLKGDTQGFRSSRAGRLSLPSGLRDPDVPGHRRLPTSWLTAHRTDLYVARTPDCHRETEFQQSGDES